MSTRNERVSDDIRRNRIAELGTVLYDAGRVYKIGAKMSALCFVPTSTREFYAAHQAPYRPQSNVVGIWKGRPFHATLPDLVTCWRADPQKYT